MPRIVEKTVSTGAEKKLKLKPKPFKKTTQLLQEIESVGVSPPTSSALSSSINDGCHRYESIPFQLLAIQYSLSSSNTYADFVCSFGTAVPHAAICCHTLPCAAVQLLPRAAMCRRAIFVTNYRVLPHAALPCAAVHSHYTCATRSSALPCSA